MQVYCNPQMRNTTNLLILNLAVADLLFILVCVPATASDYILMVWPFGLTWCRTVQYIIYVTAYVSIYTLVLMAADRLVYTHGFIKRYLMFSKSFNLSHTYMQKKLTESKISFNSVYSILILFDSPGTWDNLGSWCNFPS